MFRKSLKERIKSLKKKRDKPTEKVEGTNKHVKVKLIPKPHVVRREEIWYDQMKKEIMDCHISLNDYEVEYVV